MTNFRNHALTPDMKIFVTLRYLATGSILQVTADFNGIDKSTASRVIRQVTRTIARLSNSYIKLPEIQEETYHTRQGFFNISKFPKCIGALDCTHIRIQSPGGPQAENFRNRKGFFSFNVQAVCDAELKINNIVCRWPGSAHDSNIFRNCNLRAKFENGDYADSVLVGDSGYGIKTYLITPLGNPHTPAEHLFNESQIRTRNSIERCFGVWKRRFPILALGIRLRVEKVESIVVASAVLHNIACIMRDAEPQVNDEIEAAINFVDNVNDVHLNQNGGVNNSVRYALIHNYFANLL